MRAVCHLSILLALLLLSPAGLAAQQQPMMPESVVRNVSSLMEEAEENPQAAIDGLQDMLDRRRRSRDVKAYIARQLAALQMRERQEEAARDTLIAVLDGQPDDFALPLQLMLGQALLMLDDYTAALAQLEAWANAAEDPQPSGLFLLGYGYLRVDDIERGIARLEEAMAKLEMEPRNHWIELLAYAYSRAGRVEDARRLMTDLLTKNPGQERWWRQLASVMLLMEEVPRGTAALAIAEQVKPGTFDQQRRLARFLAHMGLPYEGAEALDAAVTSHPEEASAEDRLLLAEMWVLARELDAAIASLETVQGQMPGDGKPSLLLGQLHLHWERYEEAQAALARAVDAYGEAAPAQIHYLLAITHINLGNLDKARGALVFLDGDEAYEDKITQLRQFITSRQAAGG